MRVLVVGAGPTGLTAAVECCRRGMDVEIIDKRDAASGLSRAVGIMPKSLHLLEKSGVTKRLLEEGIAFRNVNIYRDTEALLQLPLIAPEVQFGHEVIIGLAQDRTEAILSDALGLMGVTVGYNKSLHQLSQTPDEVQVVYSSDEQNTFDYVIGADGINSTTREQVGIDFPGSELPETWSIADVDAEGWRHNDAFTISQLEAGGIVVVAPLEANRYRVIANRPDALSLLTLPLTVHRIRRQRDFTISIRQVDRYQNNRVFLAGDAAHCHSPVGGRGMNLGIADAVELAERLQNGTYDQYSAFRHADGARIIAGSERARKIMTSSSPITRLAVLLGLKLANHLSPLQRRMAQQFMYG